MSRYPLSDLDLLTDRTDLFIESMGEVLNLNSCYDAPCSFLEGVDDQGGGWLYTAFLDDPGPQEENGRWPFRILWHER